MRVWKNRSQRGHLFGPLLAAITALCLIAISAPAAIAGTAGSDPSNGSWVGGVPSPGGYNDPQVLWNVPTSSGTKFGTCVTPGTMGPLNGSYTKSSSHASYLYGELNYLYAKASTSDVRLGELAVLNEVKFGPNGASAALAPYSYLVNGYGGMSVADANAMLARATETEGPYTISFAGLPSASSGDLQGQSYTVTVTVTGPNGPIYNRDVDISDDSSNDTLSTASVTTNSNGKATFTVTPKKITGTNSFHVTARLNVYDDVDVWARSGQQSMLILGSPDTTSKSAPASADPPTGDVQVAKKDAKTGAFVAGASLKLTNSGGTTVWTGTSSSGWTTVSDVDPGSYTLTETAAPPGYYLPAVVTNTVTVTAGGTVQVLIADPAQTRIKVGKKDSATGAWIAGAGLTLKNGGGAAVWTGTSGSAPTDTGIQDFTDGATYTLVETSAPPGYYIPTGGVSSNVTASWGTTQQVSVSDPPIPTLTMTTTAHPSAALIRRGQVMSDDWNLGGNDGEPVTLTSTLYGPVAGTAGMSSCASVSQAQYLSAPVQWTATTNPSGDSGTVSGPIAAHTGCYGWVQKATVSPSGASVMHYPNGDTESSALVPPPLQVTTNVPVSSTTIGRGYTITDAITTTGDDGDDGSGVATLFGPVAPSDGWTDCTGVGLAQWTAASHADFSFSVDGLQSDGNYAQTVTGTTAKKVGCYGWGVCVALQVAQITVCSQPTDPAENVLITPPPLQVTTKVPTAFTTIGRGYTLIDNRTTAGNDGEDGTVDVTLFGPVTTSGAITDCRAVTLSQWVAANSHTYTGSIDGLKDSGNTTSTVTGLTALKIGCYGWRQCVTLTPSDLTVCSQPTDAEENVLVAAPPLAVTTNVPTPLTTIGRGYALTDDVTTAGNDGEDGTGIATVFGPVQPADGAINCTAITQAEWEAAGAATFGYTLDGLQTDGNYPQIVLGFTAMKVGCYGWQQCITLTPSELTVCSQPVNAGENVLVTPPPMTVTTKTPTTYTTIGAGYVITDEVTTAMNDGEDGAATAMLFGPIPMPDGATDCLGVTSAEWEAAPSTQLSYGLNGLNAAGNYTQTVTGPTVMTPGCYGWRESVALTPSQLTVVSQPVDPFENVLVGAPKLQLRTSVLRPSMPVKSGPLVDDVWLQGNDGGSGTLHSKLLGPINPPPGATDCSEITDATWGQAPLAGEITTSIDGSHDSGNGKFRITGPTARATGCYGWQQIVTLAPSNSTVVSPPWSRGESAIVGVATLWTEPSVDQVVQGNPVWDHIVPAGTTGSPGWITGRVLGPVPVGPSGDCTTADYAEAAYNAALSSVATSGDGDYRTAPVFPTKLGCYTFVDQWNPSAIQTGVPSAVQGAINPAGVEVFQVVREVSGNTKRTVTTTSIGVDSGKPGPSRGGPSFWLIKGAGAAILAAGLGLLINAVPGFSQSVGRLVRRRRGRL